MCYNCLKLKGEKSFWERQHVLMTSGEKELFQERRWAHSPRIKCDSAIGEPAGTGLHQTMKNSLHSAKNTGLCSTAWMFMREDKYLDFHSFQHVLISSVIQSCPALCNPMDCSMPGFPVHHQLTECVQTPVH